jgi:hypothetical protein
MKQKVQEVKACLELAIRKIFVKILQKIAYNFINTGKIIGLKSIKGNQRNCGN